MNATQTASKCDKCHGTGEYRFISKVNGKPKSGMCFQCAGKGVMTVADDKRTQAYWMHRLVSGG